MKESLFRAFESLFPVAATPPKLSLTPKASGTSEFLKRLDSQYLLIKRPFLLALQLLKRAELNSRLKLDPREALPKTSLLVKVNELSSAYLIK